MKKVVVVALSINEEILRTHFVKTFDGIKNKTNKYEVNYVVYTQGFNFVCSDVPCSFIRDDSHFNQGLPISIIREYFTDKILRDYRPDYILFCDDDFKFGPLSYECLENDLDFMESTPDVGLINFTFCTRGQRDEDFKRYKMNPSVTSMRSGLLFRSCSYDGWGGEFQVKYHEECVLATKIFAKGYRTLKSSSDTFHRTKPTGLGKSLANKYGRNSVPGNGCKALCDAGILIPCVENVKGEGIVFRYDHAAKMSSGLLVKHDLNHKEIMKGVKL